MVMICIRGSACAVLGTFRTQQVPFAITSSLSLICSYYIANVEVLLCCIISLQLSSITPLFLSAFIKINSKLPLNQLFCRPSPSPLTKFLLICTDISLRASWLLFVGTMRVTLLSKSGREIIQGGLSLIVW